MKPTRPHNLVKTTIPGLVRDLNSGAILNTDLSKFERIKAARQAALRAKDEAQAVRRELDALWAEIKVLKARLL
jgi:hypothetical protein